MNKPFFVQELPKNMNNKLILIAIVLLLIFIPNIKKAEAGLWDESPIQKVSFLKSLVSFVNSDEPLIQKKKEVKAPTITETITEDLAQLIKSYEVKNTLRVQASAYSSEPWQTDDSPFITASNTHVRDGIVAANFYINGQRVAFGTLLRIPEIFGNKIFIVEDRMNSRYTNNLDIWFADTELARQFGRKTITIEIL